jgi:hypothetical protein
MMQTMTSKKLAMILLTTIMSLGTAAAYAADASNPSNTSSQSGVENSSGSGTAKANLPPNNVDNSKINTSDVDSSKIGTNTDNQTTPVCQGDNCPKHHDSRSESHSTASGPTSGTSN